MTDSYSESPHLPQVISTNLRKSELICFDGTNRKEQCQWFSIYGLVSGDPRWMCIRFSSSISNYLSDNRLWGHTGQQRPYSAGAREKRSIKAGGRIKVRAHHFYCGLQSEAALELPARTAKPHRQAWTDGPGVLQSDKSW